jgi:hypothetical protein
MTGCCHTGRCATQDPPSAIRPYPRAGVQTTTRQEPQHDHPQSRPWTSTGATTMRAGTEIHQDGHQIASTVRHTATLHLRPCSTTVTVSLGRRRPPNRVGRTNTQPLAHLHSLTILALASITSQGLGGFPSSPASPVAPLYEHHGALQYSAMSAHLLGVRPATGTRINLVSHCCLAPAIERPISGHLLVIVRTTFRTDTKD